MGPSCWTTATTYTGWRNARL